MESTKEFAKNKNVTFENSIKKTIENSDLVIIHTEWNDFKALNFKKLKLFQRNTSITLFAIYDSFAFI